MTVGEPRELPAPWDAFLRDLDARLDGPVELHCLGAFPLVIRHNLPRGTEDIDFIVVAPRGQVTALMELGGKNTPLAKEHDIYLDLVGVADYPDDYNVRLLDLAPGQFAKIRLRALALEDIILAKLTRNSPKDRADVGFLAEQGVLDLKVLRDRYREHLRPYLANTDRHDLTLELWIDDARERMARRPLGSPPDPRVQHDDAVSGADLQQTLATVEDRDVIAGAAWRAIMLRNADVAIAATQGHGDAIPVLREATQSARARIQAEADFARAHDAMPPKPREAFRPPSLSPAQRLAFSAQRLEEAHGAWTRFRDPLLASRKSTDRDLVAQARLGAGPGAKLHVEFREARAHVQDAAQDLQLHREREPKTPMPQR